MKKIISKSIIIKCDKLPPSVDFIENSIKKENIDPIRWAIVKVDKNDLTLSISGVEIN